jgi:protein phosphatase 1B
MGAFLDKPITEKETHVGQGEEGSLTWAVSHMQGWRVSMEDAHCAQMGLSMAPKCSFFGCFDGHGGQKIAIHSARHLVDKICSMPEWKKGVEEQERNPTKAVEHFKEAMRNGSLQLDAEMRELPEVRSGEDHSGTTAVFALLTPTHIIVGNIGDSRSVMCRSGKTIAMSYDHKPTNPPEQARIEAANGSVALSRVNGDLAVSRALGDFSYKQMAHLPPEAQQVSPEPEFQVQERSPDDQFLILCCDGIWDVMTNEEVNDFYINSAKSGKDLVTTCCDLLDTCLEKKSRDNMTAVGIRLTGAL